MMKNTLLFFAVLFAANQFFVLATIASIQMLNKPSVSGILTALLIVCFTLVSSWFALYAAMGKKVSFFETFPFAHGAGMIMATGQLFLMLCQFQFIR